ncbi:MAG: hypothetical protein NVS3B1_25970 [Marmoricola sp.]
MGKSVERATIEEFETRYRMRPTDLTQRIERAVIGGDWGANGYTTLAQADRLGAELVLGPASRLLELGSGRGWPGLYLASTTGCRVVMTDVPADALKTATARARAEDLSDRAVAVMCSARDLPVRPACVDAVVHTDVLC